MESSLPDGREAPIVPDDSYVRDYECGRPTAGAWHIRAIDNDSTGKMQIMAWSSEGRKEEPLTAPMDTAPKMFDWSRQNNSLLGSRTYMPSADRRDARSRCSSCGSCDSKYCLESGLRTLPVPLLP